SPGGGFEATPTTLPTVGAGDVAVADVDGDTDADIVFACGGDDTLDPAVDSYVYLNDGSGGFASSPDVGLPTVGATSVAVADLDGTGWKDLVFACLRNGTSYSTDSVVYLGGASGWAAGPDIALPTTGASDVLPVQLTGAGSGGYISKRITPEDPSDTGAFHTFGYTAELGAGVSARVHILDATSWDPLAEQDLVTGTHEWSLAGAFDVREHPSVRVLVTVEGLGGPGELTMDDLSLNWTKRVRREPRIIDLELSATSVYRLDQVTLWVDAEDEYDPPQDLHLTVEHALNGSGEWGTYLLGTLAFKDGRWTSTVVPRTNAPLGIYDFRVRARDTDADTSVYFLA
ncbi:MAG: VCBS repeat-containing protein, partial [Thermoplasmata archaeon]|nr:VCBS repeat-containing protein [Thermoplasmata archaeon]